ncbi:MAG: hypothetical protein ABR981_01515 [Candidatus Micrarchaeaceae archaeon]
MRNKAIKEAHIRMEDKLTSAQIEELKLNINRNYAEAGHRWLKTGDRKRAKLCADVLASRDYFDLYDAGSIYLGLGLVSKAEDCAQKIANGYKDHKWSSHIAKAAELCLKVGKKSIAESLAKEARTLEFGHTTGGGWLGFGGGSAGGYRAYDANDLDTVVRLAKIWTELDNKEMALGLANYYWEIRPGNTSSFESTLPSLVDLADVYIKFGQRADAIRCLEVCTKRIVGSEEIKSIIKLIEASKKISRKLGQERASAVRISTLLRNIAIGG